MKTLLLALTLSLSLAPHVLKAQSKDTFKLATSEDDDKFPAIMYEAQTGKSWVLKNGTWRPLYEKRQPEISSYVIKIADDFAIRLDTSTGKTWKCTRDLWLPIPDRNH